jgi:hypothetical protein
MRSLIVIPSSFVQNFSRALKLDKQHRICRFFVIATIGFLFLIQPAFCQESLSKSIGNLDAQGDRGINFVFIHNYPESKEPKIACLMGAFKSGLHVTLLHKNKSRVCTAKTGAQKIYALEVLDVGEITFTKLVGLNNCSNPDEYSVAVVDSNVTSYEVIHLTELKDQGAIRALDKTVRSTRVLQELLDRNSSLVYEVDTGISRSLPRVLNYPMKNRQAYILEYEFSSDGIVLCGPRVMVINSYVRGLTGQCSYPYVRMFRINNQSYIESGSFCCECGITGQEIFRIEETGPVLVYHDYSFSD